MVDELQRCVKGVVGIEILVVTCVAADRIHDVREDAGLTSAKVAALLLHDLLAIESDRCVVL